MIEISDIQFRVNLFEKSHRITANFSRVPAVTVDHFMTANPFSILADYPAEGPTMPEQEKVVRKKDRHEPGTGYRDKIKKGGRGQGNWGNPVDDPQHPEPIEAPEPTESPEPPAAPAASPEPPEPEPERPYVPASAFFDSSDDDDAYEGVPKQTTKRSAVVPSEFQVLIAERHKGVELRSESQDDDASGIQLGFLSAKDALRQQNERWNRGGGRGGSRGGFRGGRGPRPDRDDRRRRDDRPGEERGRRDDRGGEERGRRDDRDGDDRVRRQRGGGGGGAAPGQAEGVDTAVREGPRRRGGRDARPTAVQHQREGQGGRRYQRDARFNANDFPSLH